MASKAIVSPPQSIKAQKRCFSFTLNNYTDVELEELRAAASKYEYLIVGKEVGLEGTPHLQGYIVLHKKRTYAAIHKDIPCLKRSHLEESRKGPLANITYCSKSSQFEEIGVRPDTSQKKSEETKKRTRDDKALQFKAAMDDGMSQESLALSMPGDYFYNSRVLLDSYFRTKKPKSRPTVCVFLFVGPPGVGKSRIARQLLPKAYIKDPRTKWWNGYTCQPDVIMDDLGPKSIDINHLLRWFDRHSCTVETKGSMMPLYGERFIVTSNFSCKELFTEEIQEEGLSFKKIEPHRQIPALERRIFICHFTSSGISCHDVSPLIYRASPPAFISRIRDVFTEYGTRQDSCLEEEVPTQDDQTVEAEV